MEGLENRKAASAEGKPSVQYSKGKKITPTETSNARKQYSNFLSRG